MRRDEWHGRLARGFGLDRSSDWNASAMNATAQPAFDAPNPPAHEASRFIVFVRLALVLAVITGLEIILVNLPFVAWFLYGALVSLSLVKFLCVIFVFMHLRWDRVFCTLLFLIGLVLALGTVAALLALFQSEASVPLTSPATPPSAPPAATPAPGTKPMSSNR
jgi:cytochrome c oxidase subunit IV